MLYYSVHFRLVLRRFSSSCRSSSRFSIFWSVFLGSALTISTSRGRLYGSMLAFIYLTISLFSSGVSCLATQKHFIVSFPAPSGMPIIAHSATFGCMHIICSSCAGKTFSPFTITMSFFRSRINRNPSSSTAPMSPVLSQPSSVKRSLVAFWLL